VLALLAVLVLTATVLAARRTERARLLLPAPTPSPERAAEAPADGGPTPGEAAQPGALAEGGGSTVAVEEERTTGGWRPRGRRLGLVLGVLLAVTFLFLLTVGWFGPRPPRPNLAALVLGIGLGPLLVVGAIAGGDLARALRPPRPAPAPTLPAAPTWAAPALAVPLVLLRSAGRASGREVATLALLYLVATAVGRLRCGPGWWRDGDAVAVLVRSVARLGPVERREDAWRRRPWFGGLTTPLDPAERAVLTVVLAGALARAATWLPVVVDAAEGLPTWAVWLFDLFLVGYALLILVLVDRVLRRRGVTLDASLVPLTAALVLANDLVGLIYTADLGLTLLSDPFGVGADLLGTAERGVSTAVLTSPLAWLTQLLLALVGAVVAILVQRDRDRRAEVTSVAAPVAVAALGGAAVVLLIAG
jgi:hypothetical protein